MSEEVAKAVAPLDEFDVGYETMPMGTVIEAEDSAELFVAAAAHEAVGADRVSVFLKIDDKRTAEEKVDAVEFPTFDRDELVALLDAEEDIREGRTTSVEEARERFGTSDG